MDNNVVIVASILGLVFAVIAHIVSTVWWASRITTKLDIGLGSLESVISDIKTITESYVRKDDYFRHKEENSKHLDMLQSSLTSISEYINKSHNWDGKDRRSK